jgi:hypothetical protein
MNDTERYLFDVQGYLHIPGLLTQDETARLHDAARCLEHSALACCAGPLQWHAALHNGYDYWRHPEHGYFVTKQSDGGETLMVEDFWLEPDAFDFLIGHGPTMRYVRRIVQGRISINNSELRIRYPGNRTSMHMGFPNGHGPMHAYRVLGNEINCMMVRMVYFLQDVPDNGGPMCFIPGSHKGHFPLPDGIDDMHDEPGLVVAPCRAGDGILFTEACRHGGVPIRNDVTRHTLHVGYGPYFLRSQNISTQNESVNVTDALLARLTPEQRELLVCPIRQPLTDSQTVS